MSIRHSSKSRFVIESDYPAEYTVKRVFDVYYLALTCILILRGIRAYNCVSVMTTRSHLFIRHYVLMTYILALMLKYFGALEFVG
jgi:hypothetical protein